jgi:hypothetical protein
MFASITSAKGLVGLFKNFRLDIIDVRDVDAVVDVKQAVLDSAVGQFNTHLVRAVDKIIRYTTLASCYSFYNLLKHSVLVFSVSLSN